MEKTGLRTAAQVAATSLVLVLAACGGTSNGSSSSQKGGSTDPDITVAIQGLNLQTIYPMVAKKLGYFDKAGVNVKVVVNKTSGAQAIQGLLTGNYQAYFGGADSIVAASNGEKNLRLVAAGSNDSIWDLVVNKSQVTSMADLRGKKIAVLSQTGLLTQALRYALKSHGMDGDDVTIVPAGNTPQRISALTSNQVQAAAISVPQNYAVVQEGYSDLGNLSELGAPRLVTVVMQVDDRWASKHVSALAKFLKGYQALVNDIYKGRDLKSISQTFAKDLGTDQADVKRALKEMTSSGKSLPQDLRIDKKALKNTAKAFKEYGALKDPVNAVNMIDYTYLNQAQG